MQKQHEIVAKIFDIFTSSSVAMKEERDRRDIYRVYSHGKHVAHINTVERHRITKETKTRTKISRLEI